MADLPLPRRKTHGILGAGYNGQVRVIDTVIDLTTDVTMANATDVIQIATLRAGSMILAASVHQVVVGTGTGTLQLRVGTTAVTGTLTATDPVDTFASNTAAATARVVPAGGEELNLLGATAVRTTGKIRVVAVIVEGYRDPAAPGIARRDTSV